MNGDHELEAALRRAMLPDDASDAGTDRVLARLAATPLPPQKRARFAWPSALVNWDYAPAWPRVAALACAAVLGISIGLSSLGLRIAADLDLVRVATSDDSPNAFDVDSVTGLRP
jgi:hypothetical protein